MDVEAICHDCLMILLELWSVECLRDMWSSPEQGVPELITTKLGLLALKQVVFYDSFILPFLRIL